MTFADGRVDHQVPTSLSIETSSWARARQHAVGRSNGLRRPDCYLTALQKYQSSATQLRRTFWGRTPQTFFPISVNPAAALGCQMTGNCCER